MRRLLKTTRNGDRDVDCKARWMSDGATNTDVSIVGISKVLWFGGGRLLGAATVAGVVELGCQGESHGGEYQDYGASTNCCLRSLSIFDHH